MTSPATTPVSGELTVMCKPHNRKVMLHAEPGYPARLRHMSRTGRPVEFCGAALFTVRRETVEDRDTMLAALTAQESP